MAKLFFVSLVAALCSCSGFDYTILGRLDLTPGDSVCLLAVYPTDSVINTGIVAADSTFTLKGHVREPLVSRLEILGEQLIDIPHIFIEQGVIRIALVGDKPVVAGTPMNDSLWAMNTKRAALLEEAIRQPGAAELLMEQFRQIPEALVTRNCNNLLGAFVFATIEFPLYNADSLGIVAAKARMAQFTLSLQSHPLFRRIHDDIAVIENTAVGKPYTNLVLKNAAGEPVALSSLVEAGQWVLLDFWAAWYRPCMREIPYLKKAYATFRDKGFEIYGVSLDNDPERWTNCLVENDMAWVNVLGITPDKQSHAVNLYGIGSIPQNVLISPKGVIVAKNLRVETLEETLKSVIR